MVLLSFSRPYGLGFLDSYKIKLFELFADGRVLDANKFGYGILFIGTTSRLLVARQCVSGLFSGLNRGIWAWSAQGTGAGSSGAGRARGVSGKILWSSKIVAPSGA